MFVSLVTLIMLLSFNIAVIGVYSMIITSAVLSGMAKITLSAFFTFVISVFVLKIAINMDNINKNKNKANGNM